MSSTTPTSQDANLTGEFPRDVEIIWLTDNPTERTLAMAYWARTESGWTRTVSAAAEHVGIAAGKLRARAQLAVRLYCTARLCERCGGGSPIGSRSDYDQATRWHRARMVCRDCQQREREEERERARRIEEERAALYRQLHPIRPSETLLPERLDFRAALGLLAMIRGGGTDDLSAVRPFLSFEPALAPTFELSRDITNAVLRAGAIEFHPDAALDAVDYEDGGFPRFYPGRMLWQTLIGETVGERMESLRLLRASLSRDQWPAGWREQIPAVWLEIATHEAIEYYGHVLRQHRLEFHVTDKALSVFRHLAATWSVAQLYNFSWRVAKDVAAKRTRDRMTAQHAVNWALVTLQGNAERAASQGWEVRPYRRTPRCPQTIVSALLSDVVLEVDAFDWVPGPPD